MGCGAASVTIENSSGGTRRTGTFGGRRDAVGLDIWLDEVDARVRRRAETSKGTRKRVG